MKFKILILMTLFLNACATNKKSIYATILASAATGAVIGSNQAPQDENTKAHALLWGSSLALLGSIAAIHIFDEDKKLTELQTKYDDLQKSFENQRSEFGPKLKTDGKSLVGSSIPKNLRTLVSPGSWELYDLDRWVKSDEEDHTWFRQTQMFKIYLPITKD